MTTELQRQISECETLARVYYRLVSADHHKDHDCHFYVTTKISGYPHHGTQQYTRISVEHPGYHTTFDLTCPTLEDAFDALKEELYRAIGKVMRENRDGPFGERPTDDEAYNRLMNAVIDAKDA